MIKRNKGIISLLIAASIINAGSTVAMAYENTVVGSAVVEAVVEAESVSEGKVVTLNNKVVTNGKGGELTDKLENVINLSEGTGVIRFKTESTGIQTLFSVSNNSRTNEHFHVYVNNGQIGYELRKQSGNVSVASKSAKINSGINTVAFRAESGNGYSIYVNGEKVLDITSAGANFLQALEGANTFNIGKTDRSSGNEYNFSGEIDLFEFYNEPLSDTYLKEITGYTSAYEVPLPDGALKTEPINLFSPGELGTNNFRIPSLYTTNSGTVLASIDVRKGGGHDSPNNIDSGIKRSTDGGITWDEGQIILDYPGSASAIDTSMVQDEESGRIFLLVTHFAEGYGYPNCRQGSGYKEIDGKRYLLLLDKGGKEYTLRDDNVVYDYNNNPTEYTVDTSKNLYKNGEQAGHILTKQGDLQVLGTAFLSLIYSDDDGQTWSDPVELNKDLKADWMKFFGTGPGVGHQMKNGEYKGRLVFPIYLTNSKGFQSSAVIYSDDNGQTWEVGETATDGRNMGNGVIGDAETIGAGEQLTESQVVEMPNGQLKLFMRNSSNRVRIATSFDGGATWDADVVRDEALPEPYCQLSVINYSQKVDGKEALIFSNPNAGNRINGTVRIGLINENGTHSNGEIRYEFEWKYSKVIEPGYFAYSCLTELADENGNPNGEIGLFYEGTANTDMMFTKMNSEYLKADLLSDVAPSEIVSFELDKDEYLVLDKLRFKMSFDNAVSLIGDRTVAVKLGEEEIELNLTENIDCREFIFEGTLPEGIEAGSYEVILKGKDNLKATSVYNKNTDMSSDVQTALTLNVKSLCNYDELQSLVDTTAELKEYLYAVDSWSLLQEALNKANEALEKQDLSKDEFDELTKELEAGIEGLVVRELKKELSDLIDYANTIEESMTNTESKFHEISWSNFIIYREEASNDLLDPSKTEWDTTVSIFTLNYFITDLEIKQ